MKLGELIASLQEMADSVGEECEVRMAHQPHYPLQSSISGVVADDPNGDNIRELKEALLKEKMAGPEHWDMGVIQEHEAELARLEEEHAKPFIYLLEGSQCDDSPYASKHLWEMV